MFPILICSAGRRVALIRLLAASARELGLTPRILATEMNPSHSAAAALADEAFTVPRCTAPGYFDHVAEVIVGQRVRLIVPTIDTELPILAEAGPRLRALGATPAVSSTETVAYARDKIAFAALCVRAGVMVPKTVSAPAFFHGDHALTFPLIFKPIAGSRSIGIVRAESAAEIPVLAKPEDYMVQELWRGREFTINLYVGRDGQVKCAVPHERLEVRDGEVSKGVTRRVPALCDAARRIGEALPGAYGPMCIQGILRADGVFAVFELNARFGGGYPLAHDAGAHFTRWLIEDALNLPSTAHDNWVEGRVMLRYDDAVFTDEAS